MKNPISGFSDICATNMAEKYAELYRRKKQHQNRQNKDTGLKGGLRIFIAKDPRQERHSKAARFQHDVTLTEVHVS